MLLDADMTQITDYAHIYIYNYKIRLLYVNYFFFSIVFQYIKILFLFNIR